MTQLAIDTAGANCSLALSFESEGQPCLLTRRVVRGRGQSDMVLPLARELLTEAGLAFKDLHHIYCTVGPGSFTGVRIGLAFAKGLEIAASCKLYGVSSFILLAETYFRDETFDTGERFAVIIDAGRGGLFVQSFDGAGDYYAPVDLPRLIAIEELEGYLSSHQIVKVIASVAQSLAFEDRVVGRPWLLVEAEAEKLLSIDQRHHIKEADVKPLYLRAADAKPQKGKSLRHVGDAT